MLPGPLQAVQLGKSPPPPKKIHKISSTLHKFHFIKAVLHLSSSSLSNSTFNSFALRFAYVEVRNKLDFFWVTIWEKCYFAYRRVLLAIRHGDMTVGTKKSIHIIIKKSSL